MSLEVNEEINEVYEVPGTSSVLVNQTFATEIIETETQRVEEIEIENNDTVQAIEIIETERVDTVQTDEAVETETQRFETFAIETLGTFEIERYETVETEILNNAVDIPTVETEIGLLNNAVDISTVETEIGLLNNAVAIPTVETEYWELVGSNIGLVESFDPVDVSFSELLDIDHSYIRPQSSSMKRKVAHAEILTSSPYKNDLVTAKINSTPKQTSKLKQKKDIEKPVKANKRKQGKKDKTLKKNKKLTCREDKPRSKNNELKK